jgi:uncharacterized membrane protein YagU involved in acid resistance
LITLIGIFLYIPIRVICHCHQELPFAQILREPLPHPSWIVSIQIVLRIVQQEKEEQEEEQEQQL